MSNNNWTLLRNERLPPMITPYWSYSMDSWSWRPIQYNSYKSFDTPETLNRDYRNFIHPTRDTATINPLVTARGGLSNNHISILGEATLNIPDIQPRIQKY